MPYREKVARCHGMPFTVRGMAALCITMLMIINKLILASSNSQCYTYNSLWNITLLPGL
jgi:hypothetical protein